MTIAEPEDQTVAATCEGCQQSFETLIYPFALNGRTHPSMCPSCRDTIAAERRAARDAEALRLREQDWQTRCPASYRDCTPAKLPSDAARALLAELLAWESDGTGLGIIGRQSGQGKSRLIYAVARLHFLAGMNVQSAASADLALACSGIYDNQLAEHLAPLRDTALLILDDLGKERVTERVAAVFFNLIEYRTAHAKPVLFTSNFGGDELAARFGDYGPYIVRRLREFCRTIAL